MKKASLSLILLGASLLASVALGSDFSVELGASRVHVSGVRPYAAKQNLSRSTADAMTTATVRVSYSPTKDWEFGAAYTQYDDLTGTGISPNSDIFNGGNPSAQVLTVVNSEERIRDFAFDARYRWHVTPELALEVGPVLSWFRSRAEIWPVFPTAMFAPGPHTPGRIFTASELNLGAVAGARWSFWKSWNVSVTYRYAAPKDRTLNIFTANLGYRF